jgi:hypothetical protein
MYDFILNGAGRFEQLKRSDVVIGLGEIASRYKDEWNSSEVAKRCQQNIAEPFKTALSGKQPPRLAASYWIDERKNEAYAYGPNEAPQSNLAIHFLEAGGEVYMIAAYQHEHRRTELRLYPPIDAENFDTEKLDKKWIKGLWGKNRSELDHIRLYRDRPPTTDVQFNDTKYRENESYGWALWETITSALRRARTIALREQGDLDALDLKASAKRAPKVDRAQSFDEVLPLLVAKTGKLIVDGPPGGHDLLHLLDWEGRNVAITRERGEPSRIRAFIRDKIGEKPVWLELRFPADAIVPTGGVAVAIKGNTLRIFGGLDADKQALDTEWQFDLAAGTRDAYSTATFRRGPNIPDAAAWATALASDDRTVIVGGVAGFYTEQEKPEPSQRIKALRTAIEQARANGANWATRRGPTSHMIGSSVHQDGGGYFFGPDATFDGRTYYADNEIGFVELPYLPKRLGLGQLHTAGNLLIYTAGFTAGDPPKASTEVFALDLELLDGWKPAGNCELLAGSNRLVAQDDRYAVLGLTPNARFTFIPGEKEGKE